MFVQKASGTVDLKIVPHTHHCGIDDSTLSLAYNINLTFDDDSIALDENGFLLDNTAFRGYWTGLSTNPIDISCERLAEKVGRDLIGMAGDRLHSLEIELIPFSGVSVSWHWSRTGDPEPPQQIRRTAKAFTNEQLSGYVHRLGDLIKQASEAHHIYETDALKGVRDENWPIWYADWITNEAIYGR